MVVVVLPNPFEDGGGAWRKNTRPNSRAAPQEVWTKGQKWKQQCQRWRAGETQMWDNPAEGVRRRCKTNSPSVLSCICKRTREGCDRGNEDKTVYSEWDGEGPVPPRKPMKSGRRGNCEKDFVSKKSSECA